MICNMFLKINEPKMRSVISITLGGQLADGTPVANDITRMCLRAVQILRQPFPNVGLRLFEGTPEWLYDLAIETLKMGTGNPQLINDRTWIPNFERHGYSHEDACEYYNMGCVEMMIMGRIARQYGRREFPRPAGKSVQKRKADCAVGGLFAKLHAYLPHQPCAADEHHIFRADIADLKHGSYTTSHRLICRHFATWVSFNSETTARRNHDVSAHCAIAP